MTTYQTDQLDGELLDAAVAKAQGWVRYLSCSGGGNRYWFFDPKRAPFGPYCEIDRYRPSENWGQAGELFDTLALALDPVFVSGETNDVSHWQAVDVAGGGVANGPNIRVAGLRAFVISKLGDTVELP